jgi:glycosyltransferase involved in cell wall biosynthesis
MQTHSTPSTSRRVLMLVENVSVPFDRRVWQEALALRDSAYEVVVISPKGIDRDEDSHEIREGVEIHRFALRAAVGGAPDYVREYVAALWNIRRLVRRLGAERPVSVVHAGNPPDFLLAVARPLRRRGTRLVFDHHDLTPELYESRFGRRGWPYRMLLAAERFAFRSADVVITTNDSYRKIAIERGGKHPDDVFVVRNGPDPDRFRPVSTDKSLKRGRPYLIAYLGLMGKQDGVDVAVRALAQLRTERRDWHAVFMGDGDVLDDVRRLTRDLGIADSVEFTGRVGDDRILPTLSTADVCIAPEPWSPFNDRSTIVKVVEYMAMARAVVAFDLTETRISAQDAALYAPHGDETAFAQLISTLLDDADLRRALGERGRQRVVQELGWHRSREDLLRAYASLETR